MSAEHQKLIQEIKDIDVKDIYKENLSKYDKIALWISSKIGTFKFFSVTVIWTVIWLTWNTLAPVRLQFDPYPGFVLWLFMSNCLQLFLLPMILIGQNIQSNRAEKKNDEEYRQIIKSEKEIELILAKLDELKEIIKNK